MEIKCVTCNGTGVATARLIKESKGNSSVTTWSIPCQSCAGTGRRQVVEEQA